jgi:membrane protease YdiL (CAAX protease family)
MDDDSGTRRERRGGGQPHSPPPPGRREQGYELAVFLALVVPSMALSFFVVRQGTLGFPIVAVSVILRDLALTALVRFFAWRNGEPMARLGWWAGQRWREVGIAVLLFPVLFYGAGFLDELFARAGLSSPATPMPAFLAVRGPSELLLAVVLVVVVAVSEETVFRGYLILRLRELTGSPVAAVLLSSLIFSLGHGYEGTAGVATVGCLGVALATVYLWRGSLLAPVILHFLQDFAGIVLAALLGGR